MLGRYEATALFGMLMMLTFDLEAADQRLDAARAARERAKADLVTAQRVFDRADDEYISVLSGVTGPRPVTAAPAARDIHPHVVTFTVSGPRAQVTSPLEYRARVIVDGEPVPWTQHASGVKLAVPADARSLEYEVQNDQKGDALNRDWKTVCSDKLPVADATINITIAHNTICNAK